MKCVQIQQSRAKSKFQECIFIKVNSLIKDSIALNSQMVNSPWKSNELPPSGETDSGIRPTVKNLGDTHIAMRLERYTPSLCVPSKSQMILKLLLKQGPLMNTCVPPSIVPTDGNTTRFPVSKKAEE